MIKANELRVGNWVTAKVSKGKEMNLIVNGVYISTPTPSESNIISFGRTIPTINVIGIPLTPKLLEKCGFEGHPILQRRFIRIGETNLTAYLDDGEFSIQDYDWFEMKMPQIQYLHQLQNLYFALTGEELNIKI